MIISLCDRTGVMVKPWANAGYPCLCLDLQHSIRNDRVEGNITFRWADIRSVTPAELPTPTLIFAFPPCTNLSVSGARDFKRKGLRGLIDALEVVEACRRLCEWFKCPWMLENPVSRLASCWRQPDHYFQPWEYGDLWSKKTAIWCGNGFVMPPPANDSPPEGTTNKIHMMTPGPERANLRSETPPNFARAVFEANRP